MSEERLTAIGQITLEFANLEWLLDNLYAGLNCDFKTRENSPTDFDSLSKRLTLIGYRIEKKHSGRMKDWHDLEWEVRNLAKERDRALHSMSRTLDSADLFIAPEPKREYSVPQLIALSEKTAQAAQKIAEFLSALHAV